MRARYRKNVFCLEGDWSNNSKQPCSSKPVFDLLGQTNPRFRYVHRVVETPGEFEHLIKKWTQKRYDDYPVLWLAFHGDRREGLSLGDQRRRDRTVSLDHLRQLLTGKCHNRYIHFSSCSVLDVHGHTLNSFLRDTDAIAVSGYEEDVTWMPSAVMEVLLLDEYQRVSRGVRSAHAVKSRMQQVARSLTKNLGFRMVVRKD